MEIVDMFFIFLQLPLPSSTPVDICGGRGRPKETWRRTVEAKMKQQGWTWDFLERAAQDRNKWKDLVDLLLIG